MPAGVISMTFGLQVGKKVLGYSGAALWKSLPCDIRESGSLNQFKRLLFLSQHS